MDFKKSIYCDNCRGSEVAQKQDSAYMRVSKQGSLSDQTLNGQSDDVKGKVINISWFRSSSG